MEKLPLVIINSPTATGKTQLAVNLALEFGGEVISADSMQVYRYLDIGTAKPTMEERRGIKHHLIDIVNPDEEFNVALFAESASKIISELSEKETPIFVVGGTGLYIRALLRGIIETPDVDEKSEIIIVNCGVSTARSIFMNYCFKEMPLPLLR